MVFVLEEGRKTILDFSNNPGKVFVTIYIL